MNKEKRTIRVLLVDDEDAFRLPLAKRLSKRGFEVIQASGGRQALELLDKDPLDVIVLDVKMPDMGGLVTMSEIKKLRPQTEVILLTGQTTARDGVEGMKAGAFDYLGKPIELEQLAGKIRQAHEKAERTEEKAHEAEFRAKMEQKLAAAERLASLGELAAGVAHEINNPLAIISESAGWLKSRFHKDDSINDDLRKNCELAISKIERSVERAGRITHQLLSFARRNDTVTREFDLGVICDETAELTRKTAEQAGASVQIQNITDNPVIWSDPFQIRQVLINIVNNGLQASRSGGKVEIILTESDKDVIMLSIRDNGPGIPKENLERIFEPFFSTKPPGSGTGLGLSVSRSIIEKLGGRIEVESKLGVGSNFRIFLPRKPLTAA